MDGLDELDRCRLCSTQNNLTDIFGTPYKDELLRMIYACLSIRITFERDFPCAVCTSCIRIVKQFYSYRRKCLDHDRNLKRLRGEENDDEEDEDFDDDNVSNKPKKQRLEQEVRDGKFYENVKRNIHKFLAVQVKKIERKALEKVNEALMKRKDGNPRTDEVLLQMTVEPALGSTDGVCEEVEYEELNDTDGFCQEELQDEYKMELESVYLTADTEGEQTEVGFAGFDELTENQSMVGTESAKKRKRLTGEAIVTSQTKVLQEQITEAQRKIDTLTQLSQELELKRQKLESGAGIISTRFTTEKGIQITAQQLNAINDRASSDSAFVGMLITRLIDPKELRNMSVTGHASLRFSRQKKPDGSPLYPAMKKIDPRIFDFVCNKVAERTAMRIGPDDILTIRKNSDERLIKKYIAQKISNVRKAYIAKRSRSEGETPSSSETPLNTTN